MKKEKNDTIDFGKRLAFFRKAKGLTQRALGKRLGVSNRVIAYYEGETKYPPARFLVPLADILEITTDELLGRVKNESEFDPQNAALRRKLRIVEKLAPTDQKAILHYIKMITTSRGIDQKNQLSK